MTTFVFTIIARDRSGLVGEIAAVVRDHGGSWVDSSLTHLAGVFAGIVQVEVAPERLNALKAELGGLSAHGIQIAGTDGLAVLQASVRRATVSLACVDRPGIIRDLSAALYATGASFESLETSVEHGSMSGEVLFTAHAVVSLAEGIDARALSMALEELSPDLMADVEMLDGTLDPVG